MTTPDPNYLKSDQYKDATKLAARGNLHAKYSRNGHGWYQWQFELYLQALPPDARILELGAGAGWLWANNADRIPAGWQITLSDFSPGMLDEQRKTLANATHPFQHEEIDAQAIPYADATFDAVLANHMLYHVPDRARAIAEMRRVLKPDGVLFAATNGAKHMRELHALMERFKYQRGDWLQGFMNDAGFQLENGAEQLRAQFGQIEMRHYDDALEIPAAEPLIAYILSLPVSIPEATVAKMQAVIEAEIARNGKMLISKDTGVLIAKA